MMHSRLNDHIIFEMGEPHSRPAIWNAIVALETRNDFTIAQPKLHFESLVGPV